MTAAGGSGNKCHILCNDANITTANHSTLSGDCKIETTAGNLDLTLTSGTLSLTGGTTAVCEVFATGGNVTINAPLGNTTLQGGDTGHASTRSNCDANSVYYH